MKFLKTFFIFCILLTLGCVTLLVVAVQNSTVQEICLKMALRTQFNTVAINGYVGSSSTIQARQIALQNETQSLTIENLLLEWNPWNLLTKRELNIKNLRMRIAAQCQSSQNGSNNFPPKKIAADGTKHSENPYAFLQDGLLRATKRLPIRLRVERIDVQLQVDTPTIQIEETHLHLQNLVPNATAKFNYKTTIHVPFQQADFIVQPQGEIQIKSAADSSLQAINLQGALHFKRGKDTLPTVNYQGHLKHIPNSLQEDMQLAIRCGTANDISITGGIHKTTDHLLTCQWKILMDQTLVQAFANLQTVPTVSLLSEGTINLHAQTQLWTLHTLTDLFAKNFDQNLKTLPSIAFKTTLDAECGSNHATLKQCNISLKENNTKRVFFSAQSKQPITYSFQDGLQLPSKNHFHLMDIKCHEIPFGILNPFIDPYGYYLVGHLNSGNIQISLEQPNQQLTVTTTQPIRANIKRLSFHGTHIVSDVNGQWEEHFSANKNFSQFNWRSTFTLSDTKLIPFFTFSPQGTCSIQGDTIEFSTNGKLNFNYFWAKNWLNLTPFQWALHPEFWLKTDYHVHGKVMQKKNAWESAYTLQDLKTEIASANTQKPWVVMHTLQPITVHNGIPTVKANDPLLVVDANQCPLNLMSHQEVPLKGTLSLHTALFSDGKSFRSELKPFTIENLKAGFQNKPYIDFKSIHLKDLTAHYHPGKWAVQVNDLRIDAPQQKEPLLLATLNAEGKDAELIAANGHIHGTLDALPLQPFAALYPELSFVGEMDGQGTWNHQKKSADLYLNLSPTELPCTTKTNIHYEYTPAHAHAIKGDLKLHHQNHVNDLAFQQTLTNKNILTGHITSNQLFLNDFVKLAQDAQKLAQKINNKTASTPSSSKQSVQTSAKETSTSKATVLPIQGTIDFHLKSLVDVDAQNVMGTLVLDPTAVSLKNFSMQFCEGIIKGSTDYNLANSNIRSQFTADSIQLANLWIIPANFDYPLDAIGQLSGTLGFNAKASGNLTDPENLYGNASLQMVNGTFVPKKSFSFLSVGTEAISQTASLIGSLTNTNIPGVSVIGFLSDYLKKIQCTRCTAEIDRSKSEKATFKAHVMNNDLGVALNGHVGLLPYTPMQDQALKCALQFSAPSESPFNTYFNFDEHKPDSYGYGIGPNCTITGTVGNPNYSALTDLLQHVRVMPQQPQKKKTEPSKSSEPSNQTEDFLDKTPLKGIKDSLMNLF